MAWQSRALPGRTLCFWPVDHPLQAGPEGISIHNMTVRRSDGNSPLRLCSAGHTVINGEVRAADDALSAPLKRPTPSSIPSPHLHLDISKPSGTGKSAFARTSAPMTTLRTPRNNARPRNTSRNAHTCKHTTCFVIQPGAICLCPAGPPLWPSSWRLQSSCTQSCCSSAWAAKRPAQSRAQLAHPPLLPRLASPAPSRVSPPPRSSSLLPRLAPPPPRSSSLLPRLAPPPPRSSSLLPRPAPPPPRSSSLLPRPEPVRCPDSLPPFLPGILVLVGKTS